MIVVLVVLLLTLLVSWLIWWLFFETEGVYLGQRVVIWLYDVYAERYDAIVQHDDIDDHMHLAQPILERIAANTTPRVLDVATGTGRLPLALCQHARFEGHIAALDLSEKMLEKAIQKIDANHFNQYVTFLLADGQRLPFPEDTFDVVTCLEALEFMPDQHEALIELVRVLRPGGLLLTTQRLNIRTMPGKIWSAQQIESTLCSAGVAQIEFDDWQHDYAKVWGVKSNRVTC